MVTAELAMTLPALVLVTGLLMWAVGAVSTQMRCVDAARAAARSLARGDSAAAATAAARVLAPGQATIHLSRAGGTVTVRVTATVDPPGALDVVAPALTVSNTASIPVEEEPWPAG
ncbi:MAG: TadE family type IV pilus minor pilin [Actinomycetes bacterium]